MNHLDKRKLSVVFAFGTGGHKTQMDRLMVSLIGKKQENDYWIAYTDDLSKFDWADEVLYIIEPRSKIKFSPLDFFKNLIFSFKNFIKIYKNSEKIKMISVGPGHVIFFGFLTRVFGGEVLHIETWSRFHTKSFTGRIMYLISNKFYVQNKELLKIYKNSIYSGRL
ncbi:PssD/Cps14F family polysaccharide biosynthesis glycosyltransferase [Providencia rettgeri]|uniref:PssD/Cps14F family polysaccharide biosynthesis glycosyltransferase n=1 Tax=Providencia sp. PROV272 TaxID=2936800 RepID=UPI0034E7C9EF